MTDRNTVSLSIAIHGYAINGYQHKSLNLFSHLRKSGFAASSFTVVGVLVSASVLRDSFFVKSVHGLVVKCGFGSGLIVGTSLLGAYASCGNVVDSVRVFEELESPGLVSCNAILSGLMNNEMYREGVLLFMKLRRSGFLPDNMTVLSLVKGSVAVEDNGVLCTSLHGLILKLGLALQLVVGNSLLDMYSSLIDLDSATKVFDEMIFKDVISWTTMMGLLLDLGYGTYALSLFSKMRDSGVDTDAIMLVSLVSACGSIGHLQLVKQIHAKAIVCQFVTEISLANSIITMYSKSGNLDSSKTLFEQMSEKSSVSWTTLISAYLQNGQPVEALNLIIKATHEEGHYLDSVMLVNALLASGDLAAIEICSQLHSYSFKVGFSLYKSVQNSLISAYSKCGNIDFAHFVFEELGHLRNIVSWNAIINGHGINGQGENALALYCEMRGGEEDLDSTTYLCVLSACSHAGLVNDGLKIFNVMIEENRFSPTQEHYGCIIDLLGRGGCLSKHVELGSTFFEGIGPNVWKALLNGCALHSNVKLAELAAKKIIEHNPGDSEQLVLLSNLYASVGRFHDAEVLRLSFQRNGYVKNPGTSFSHSSS